MRKLRTAYKSCSRHNPYQQTGHDQVFHDSFGNGGDTSAIIRHGGLIVEERNAAKCPVEF